MFTTQTRTTSSKNYNFASIAEAVRYGMSLKMPFDVSAPSGAIVWAWEMR